MKKAIRILVPVLLAALIVFSLGWYLFSYDRDFTRDALLSQARFQDLHGNSRLSSWFYHLAYNFSDKDEDVAIELANQYKADGNYTKAEYTLSNAINEDATTELYIALCKTYVEQDKLLDAVSMLANIADPDIKAQLDAMRPTAPEADYAPGFYAQYISVSLSSSDGTLYCTTDGEFPSISGAPYSDPITLSSGETSIYAISVADNGLVSPLSILGYTVGGVIEPAVFTDPAMESCVRELLNLDADYTIYTNDLWGITEFTLPENVKSLEDLRLMPYLLTLSIPDHQLEDLDALTALTRLEKLDLSGSRFPSASLSVLASIPTLRDLTLANCGLSTVADLADLRGLTRLDLGSNTIRNLEPLSQMSTLRELDLQHNAVISLEDLASLGDLERLDVSYNSLTTLAPLADCRKLTWLEAGSNAIADVQGLDQLTLLEYLSLEYNKLTDISLLSACEELTELSVSNNSLTDLSALSTMGKLDILDFSYNSVEELPQWKEGCTLRIIDGTYNALTSIDNLAELDQISYIYMDYNSISDVNALADCYHLVQLNVYGNEVKDVSQLTEHNIIVNYDPT